MKTDLVIKHNDLIEARYDLNLMEQKIILYAATKIDTNKDNFNMVQIKVSDLTELMDTTIQRYKEFSIIAEGLMDKGIYFKDRPDFNVRWVASSEYIGDGIIELEFSQKLIPYLLQLKNKFTRYQLENILNLKSKYSIRLYELMKQYEKIGKREFDLEELKRILYCEGMYSDFRNFDRVVLANAKQEINKHTDINIDYDKLKTGRRITSILFKVEPKDQQDRIYIEYLNQSYNIKEMQLKMGLSNENFNSKQIINIYELAVKKLENEEEKNIFEYIRLNYLHIRDKARNKYSYLLKALENDYAVAAAQIKLDYYL